MVSQIVAQPVVLFLIMTAFSIFLFAVVRFLMHTLYTRELRRWGWFADRVDRLTKKGLPLLKRYGALGLVLFIALPVPGTGVVGGTILSSLAGYKWYTSFLAVIPATAIENVLITFGATGILRLFNV